MKKPTRVLIKISGEALAGSAGKGLDATVLERFTSEMAQVARSGIQTAVVMGAGNFYRGLQSGKTAIGRVEGDFMGMTATVINAMALQGFFKAQGVDAEVFSALYVEKITRKHYPPKAVEALEAGKVVLFAGGTGNPFFTTDTAGVLRAVEIDADLMLKATRVDGVYSDDPEKNPAAKRYDRLSYDEALEKNLRIMDATAFALARENRLPIVVFDINTPGNLAKLLIEGQSIGTVVGALE